MTDTPPRRVLITGGRDWRDVDTIESAIVAQQRPGCGLTIVHGAAVGADELADAVARNLGLDRDPYPARDFASPRARNEHMVNQGADICLAFALSWASGTGMCARMARRASIPVLDFGVNTSAFAGPAAPVARGDQR